MRGATFARWRKAREEARAMAEPVDKKNVPDSLDNGSVQQAKGKPLYKSKKARPN